MSLKHTISQGKVGPRPTVPALVIFDKHIKLSLQMTEICSLLWGGRTLTAWELATALGLKSTLAEKQIAVQICKMKPRLEAVGLTIECVVGKGYRLVWSPLWVRMQAGQAKGHQEVAKADKDGAEDRH